VKTISAVIEALIPSLSSTFCPSVNPGVPFSTGKVSRVRHSGCETKKLNGKYTKISEEKICVFQPSLKNQQPTQFLSVTHELYSYLFIPSNIFSAELPRNDVKSPGPRPGPVFAYMRKTSPVSLPVSVPFVIHILEPLMI
jgi:hypothetical protein